MFGDLFRDKGMLPGCIIDDPSRQLADARTYLSYRRDLLERETDPQRRERLLAEITRAQTWVARLTELVQEQIDEQEPGQ